MPKPAATGTGRELLERFQTPCKLRRQSGPLPGDAPGVDAVDETFRLFDQHFRPFRSRGGADEGDLGHTVLFDQRPQFLPFLEGQIHDQDPVDADFRHAGEKGFEVVLQKDVEVAEEDQSRFGMFRPQVCRRILFSVRAD